MNSVLAVIRIFALSIAGRIAFRELSVGYGAAIMTRGLAWALAILMVVGIWCLYYLHQIAKTLKKILGHFAGVSEDVNGMVEDVEEVADAARKIRDNTSKK